MEHKLLVLRSALAEIMDPIGDFHPKLHAQKYMGAVLPHTFSMAACADLTPETGCLRVMTSLCKSAIAVKVFFRASFKDNSRQ